MKPFGKRIIVELETDKVTESGIIIPESKDPPKQGTVVEVNYSLWEKFLQKFGMPHFNKGDTVLFGAFAGDDFEIHGRKYRVIMRDSILVGI